jgi:hypothetical protein
LDHCGLHIVASGIEAASKNHRCLKGLVGGWIISIALDVCMIISEILNLSSHLCFRGDQQQQSIK